jgi:hypothetical protein
VNRTKLFAVIAGALVAGAVLGSVTSGYAATANGTTNASATAACAGLGLRMGQSVRESGGRLLDIVAKLTGQTTTQVAADRAAGKTFAQIAADKGVSQTAVIDSALKVRQDALSAKVKSGAITQSQADTAVSTMKARLSDRVTSSNTSCNGQGAGGGGGCGMGGGGNGAGCGARGGN